MNKENFLLKINKVTEKSSINVYENRYPFKSQRTIPLINIRKYSVCCTTKQHTNSITNETELNKNKINHLEKEVLRLNNV